MMIRLKNTSPLLLIFFGILFSNAQTIQFIRPGQKYSGNHITGLVLKNDKGLSKNYTGLSAYKEIHHLKLSGFKTNEFDLDSILLLVQDYSNIESITFEDCDLNLLTIPLNSFISLKQIRVQKRSEFEESLFFPLLKKTPVEQLFIEHTHPELQTDSLILLPHITFLALSDKGFNLANKKEVQYLTINGNRKSITVEYHGSFHKSKHIPRAPVKKDALMSHSKSAMSCLNPPVPGININDTLYYLNASKGATFNYFSGSILNISPNIFFRKDGTLYNGPVKLFYREFRNAVDIMLSGIPMSNVENGERKVFRSGGMYEISAFDDIGKPLNTKNESGITINFALTDTATDFSFYSLSDTGQWSTLQNTVSIQQSRKSGSKAIIEYLVKQRIYNGVKLDTTKFHDRYKDLSYYFTYRSDNLIKAGKTDSTLCIEQYLRGNRKRKVKSFYRIKFLKKTKEDEIVFMLTPAKKRLILPRHISRAMNCTLVYAGDISKEEFKRKFNRKVLFWDLRTTASDTKINFELKTNNQFISMSAYPVVFKEKEKYYIPKRAAHKLSRLINGALATESKIFARGQKKHSNLYNNANTFYRKNAAKQAWQDAKQYMTLNESALTFDQWKSYVQANTPSINSYNFTETPLGSALVSSGLGIKNIDCYIHSGQMENIYASYNYLAPDTVKEIAVMLFKSINTSYPLYFTDGVYNGYYFKNKPNYLIRFSNGFMQVSSPRELAESKKNERIDLTYESGHDIRNLNSREITKLILSKDSN